jgi:hypothetical protein
MQRLRRARIKSLCGFVKSYRRAFGQLLAEDPRVRHPFRRMALAAARAELGREREAHLLTTLAALIVVASGTITIRQVMALDSPAASFAGLATYMGVGICGLPVIEPSPRDAVQAIFARRRKVNAGDGPAAPATEPSERRKALLQTRRQARARLAVMRIFGALGLVLLTAAIAVAILLRLDLPDTYLHIAQGALIVSLGFSAYFAIGAGVAYLLLRVMAVVRWRALPAVWIFVELSSAMNLIEAEDFARDISAKRRVIGHLNRVANAFETGLPRRLGLTNHEQPSFEHLLRTGEYFRGLVSWVATPRADTREHLKTALVSSARALVTGEYHELPVAETSQPRPRRSLVALRVLRAAAVAAIPGAALIALQVLDVKLPEQVRTTWAIASAVWAAVVVVSSLDPSYSDKITATRTALGPVLPGKPGSPGSPGSPSSS